MTAKLKMVSDYKIVQQEQKTIQLQMNKEITILTQ